MRDKNTDARTHRCLPHAHAALSPFNNETYVLCNLNQASPLIWPECFSSQLLTTTAQSKMIHMHEDVEKLIRNMTTIMEYGQKSVFNIASYYILTSRSQVILTVSASPMSSNIRVVYRSFRREPFCGLSRARVHAISHFFVFLLFNVHFVLQSKRCDIVHTIDRVAPNSCHHDHKPPPTHTPTYYQFLPFQFGIDSKSPNDAQTRN